MQRIDRPFLLERAVDFIQSIVRYLKLCRIYFRIFDSLATPYGHENEVYNSMMSFCNVND